MRGEKEQRCLEIVKYDLLNNYPKNFFGLNYEEVENIKKIINETKSNENLNMFPDFVFNNGFIEHFQVTSSKENKKGSVHIKEINKFKNKIEIEKAKLYTDDNFHSKHWTMKYSEHNYENLVNSLKNNWNSHIESLHKYAGNKDISIFMIQYSDMALEMYENIFGNWIDGMSNGDLREPEKLDQYRLTRDKNLLNFIYNFKDELKYVIFVYKDQCEIIKLENIPYIINLIPWEYVIASHMNSTIVSSLYKISSIKKGDLLSE